MSEIQNYNTDIEELFIRFFLTYPELFVRCKAIIDPKHYSTSQHKKTISFLEEHASEYSTLPTIDQIAAIAGKHFDLLDGIQDNHINWFLTEYETFARHKALEIEIFNAPELLQQGRYGEVEANIKRAVQLGLVKDLGTDYFLDVKSRLEGMKNKVSMISTGWRDLDDKLYGGFERGTLNFFVGATGAGKSLFLQNIGVNYAMQGLDVVYLTLELSEKLCSLRIDAMITGYGTKDVLRNVDDSELRIATFAKKYKGTFQIKQMLTGSTSNDFRAYIKEYEIQTGIKVDVLIVDYIDLCMPASKKIDPSNLFIKDKFVSEELRNLAVELDLVLVSAIQFSRGAYDELEFNASHTAGGISKIYTADNAIAIFTTNTMKENGKYQLQLMKTRSSSGVGQHLDLKFNKITMKISDADEQTQEADLTNSKNILDQLRKRNVTKEQSNTNVTNTDVISDGSRLREMLKKLE